MLHPFNTLAYNRMVRVLCEREKSGRIKVPDASSPIEIDEKAKLTFVVWADSQVSDYMYARESCLYSACLDIKNMSAPLDALVIAGDIAENGYKAEYDMTAYLLNGISGKFRNFITCPGNHDVRMRPYRRQMKRFISFCNSVTGNVKMPEDRYNFSCEINGYKFIVMGTDAATFEGAYISKKQLLWLDREIASTQDSGKPVFVINHQTLKKTNGLPHTWTGKGSWRGSVGWQSGKIRAVFEKYRNVIFITGHVHFGTDEHSYEDCGAFKAVSVQTVGAGNHGSTSDDTQGMVFSVYDDRIVVRARVFGDGKYVDKSISNAEFEIRI